MTITEPSDSRRAVLHLLDYLHMRPGRLLVAYERPYSSIVNELCNVAASSGEQVDILPVEDVPIPELRTRLMGADRFLCAFNRTYASGIREHVQTMVECGVDRAERAFTLSDISADFVRVFHSDPYELAETNAKLIRVLQNGQDLVVQDSRGSDLAITFDSQYEWVNQDGFTEADYALTMNLPVGEVATYTPHVNGVLQFVGGLLGTIPIGRKYGHITEPIRIEIEDGRVVDIEAPDAELQRDILFCIDFDEYTRQVNEIGFGTNSAITGPVRGFNYKHEESRVGFHLGLGASLAQQNVERLTPHHLDFLLDDCHMTLDGRALFDGDYRFENFPEATRSERLRTTNRSCCMPSAGISPEAN